jgi:anaerobic glycerol-3-phosphate dehydrogenase
MGNLGYRKRIEIVTHDVLIFGAGLAGLRVGVEIARESKDSIKCSCCMAACPTMATDRQYLGPMPLAQAYRYNKDTSSGVRDPHG